MKKVNLVAIIIVVLVVIAAIVVLSLVLSNCKVKIDDSALLRCLSVADVEDYIKDNKLEFYTLEADSCQINRITIFGYDAVVEYSFSGKTVSMIRADSTLFQDSRESLSEEERTSSDIMSYKFDQETIEVVEQAFSNVKSSFEQFIGCKLEHYDVIPAYEDVPAEDNEELFYQGKLIREYSVRDQNNVLWLLRFHASYGMAHATLTKLADDTGYDGFIPSVDLTKTQE